MANEIYTVGGAYIKDIADAIREKTGKSEGMTIAQMPQEILSIETGGGGIDFSDIGCEVNGDTVTYTALNTQSVYIKVHAFLYDIEYAEDYEHEFWLNPMTGKHDASACTIETNIAVTGGSVKVLPASGFEFDRMQCVVYALDSQNMDFNDLLYHLPNFRYNP